MTSLSRKFRDLMQRGNVNGAIKLLTNNMQNGILPLNEETITSLRLKHPQGKIPTEDSLLQGPQPTVEPVIFDVIDEDMVMKAAQLTKGGSGPSGMDADGWRRILISKDYGNAGSELRVAIARVIRSICTVEIADNSIAALMASRLVPLDKRPGVRPIGVGEVLRRIMGKVVMGVVKTDVVKSCSKNQMCGQKSGSEAVIHAMKKMFNDTTTDAVLLVDAANAFNSLNRQVFLHNIGITCPIIATYIRNCYSTPARLFVIGGIEIKSDEGTTQGDPLGMAIYAIATTPLFDSISESTNDEKEVAFADDITATGKLDALKTWWDLLMVIGPQFGYFPQPRKSWLIVKPEELEKANAKFQNSNIKITSEGKKHLGAVIGSEECKKKYLREKVDEWIKDIRLLSEIAITQPQAAYACFISGYQHKMTYFMRTIPGCDEELSRIDDAMRHKFFPAITGGHIVNDSERQLLSLLPRLGGLGLRIFSECANEEYNNSQSVTIDLQEQILGKHTVNHEAKTKQHIKNEQQKQLKQKLDTLLSTMSEEERRRTEANSQKGVSNWLTSLPIKEYGFDLSKQEFRDAIRLRYGWTLERLPITCACGSRFDVSHALS